jgi:hypothetical protein
MKKKRTVKYEIDLCRPLVLTTARKAELRVLKTKPESTIDYSDIPPLDDTFWENAIRNPFYLPRRLHKPQAGLH